MVGGVNGGATRVYRARNAFESPLRYTVHPQDLFRIKRAQISERGEELTAIYHSHPNGGLSVADRHQPRRGLARRLW